jgi:hypothetical protein
MTITVCLIYYENVERKNVEGKNVEKKRSKNKRRKINVEKYMSNEKKSNM